MALASPCRGNTRKSSSLPVRLGCRTQFDLKERHLDNDYVQWIGEGISEQTLEETRKEVHFAGNFVEKIKSAGKGPAAGCPSPFLRALGVWAGYAVLSFSVPTWLAMTQFWFLAWIQQTS